MTTNPRTLQIRALNDRLRCHHVGGSILLAPNIRQLGHGYVSNLLKVIAAVSAFPNDADADEEHQSGTIEWLGRTFTWEITYYDRKLRLPCPDPADEDTSERILAITLAADNPPK